MIIICDIDGTAANIDHRRHYVQGNKKRWDKFFEAMASDKPNYWCQTLLKAMSDNGHDVYFVTGRPANYRKKTQSWLQDHYSNVLSNPLYMRPENNTEPDYVIKKEILDMHFDKSQILFVIDDRKQVVDMWREQGITVLQCDEGNF